MDDLKEGIHLRSYAQKDPLLEYKQEAYNLFVELVEDINKNSVQIAFRFFPQQIIQQTATNVAKQQSKDAPTVRKHNARSNYNYEHSATTVPTFVTNTATAPKAQQTEGVTRGTAIRTERREQPKIGRNDVCPCGSGKKYKNCHGRNE